MSLIAIALLNGLLGAIRGVWFRAYILIPLITVAFVEVAILKQAEIWSSVVWSSLVLITLLEIGYLIGSSLSALWLYPDPEKRALARPGHGRLSHHWWA